MNNAESPTRNQPGCRMTGCNGPPPGASEDCCRDRTAYRQTAAA